MKNRYPVLIACLFAFSFMLQAQVPSYVPSKNLVGWWPFNGDAKDYSGNGNHFTVNGASLTSDRDNNSNAAYEFNGSKAYLDLNSLSHTFTPGGSFTVSVWIKKTSTDAGVALNSGTTSSNYFVWDIQGDASEMAFGTNSVGNSWLYAKSSYKVNDWDHYVAVYLGDSMILYKNTVRQGSNFFNYPKVQSGSLPLYVGMDNNGRYFTGIIDDIGIWSTDLNSNQIRILYNAKCDKIVSIEPTNQLGRIGSFAKFTVGAIADSFRWQVKTTNGFVNTKNGAQYSGAQTKTLTVISLKKTNDQQEYRCILKTGACFDTTKTVVLSVCGDIKQHPLSRSAFVTDNVDFTIVSNDDQPVFQWQSDQGSGFSNLSNTGQYSGANSDVLGVSSVKMGNNDQKFRCVVQQGACTDTSAIATLKVCGKIISQPSDKSVIMPDAVTFSASSSEASAGYQWQMNKGSGFNDLSDNSIFGGTQTKSLSMAATDASYNRSVYRCVITHGGCTDTTGIAELTVCGKLTEHPKDQAILISATAQFTAASNDVSATYQWQINQGFGYNDVVNGGQFSGANTKVLELSNATVFNNNQKFRCVVTHGECTENTTEAKLSVCGTVTAHPGDQQLKIGNDATFEAASDDQFATFQWQMDNGSGFSDLNNGGQFSGSQTNKLIINKASIQNHDQKFRCIIIHGACTDTTSIALLKVCGEITFQPPSKSVEEGKNVQFTVASNDDNAGFQWQSNDGNGFKDMIEGGTITGTKTNILTLSNVSLSDDQNEYRNVITSGNCMDTSSSAVLTVTQKVGISTLRDQDLINVFPNPNNGVLNIIADARLMGSQYSLFNLVGERLASGKIESGRQSLDMADLVQGIYVLQVGETIKLKIVRDY
ncbi:MAG: T9SS type A sorting domain-containing protein [Flavobacteriales bacterium]|nr:T9SS type A sorting domain-containing protein [Flavobacteriales bacterium]